MEEKEKYLNNTKPITLPEWVKDELDYMGKDGYHIIPVTSEQEANTLKAQLREEKKCARTGYIKDKGVFIYFVLTRDRIIPNRTN